jgi:D-arabinose 1-dehydrogenase-like Zn-dependent alcohol dehydrogenase
MASATTQKTMRAVQVREAKSDFAFVDLPIPEPGPGQVRVKVQACGICHSDVYAKDGLWPGITYPRIPGHEVAGIIDAVGPGVVRWQPGQRVGVGWYAGHCGYCDSCRRGDFLTCQTPPRQITAISTDGGYAEFMIASANALALIPDSLAPAEAAPLMCAGVTTYNSLRHSGAVAGDLVAILGVGGLGHLGVQFAARMGFRTVAIARGKDKEPLARKLGAHVYLDSQSQDPAAELGKLGGAKVILATVTNAKTMSAVVPGLGIDGKLLVVGAPREPLQAFAGLLIGGRRSVAGWPSGTAIDSQDTMSFCALTGVRSMNETYPFERAPEAYDRMMSGHARFRVVLTMAS